MVVCAVKLHAQAEVKENAKTTSTMARRRFWTIVPN
jgi:hypothetical protein